MGRTKKLRRVILPILLLLKLKAAIVIPVVLSLIALVAFNGLGAGVTALAIAGATGLKSLLESHGPSKVSYEIVPQVIAPQWSRSSSIEENLQDVLPMKAGYHTLPWK
ncbi:hypothetical protein JTB14_035738 [Gonioctena quinquepunctata]|nr:hypothetical protein JTB14_035738 [Gonioctena quinquepunctata]